MNTRDVSLAGFVQLLREERATAIVRVESPALSGALRFDRGMLTGAEAGALRGNAAVVELLRLADATFELCEAGALEEQEDVAPLSYLVLEAARRADEIDAGRWETVSLERNGTMADIKASLKNALKIPGCIGAALVDYETGLCEGAEGSPGFDLEHAAAGNQQVVKAKKSIRDALGLRDKIENIIIELTTQLHIIRMVGTTKFLYVVLDREKSNMALARKSLEIIEKGLDVDRT